MLFEKKKTKNSYIQMVNIPPFSFPFYYFYRKIINHGFKLEDVKRKKTREKEREKKNQ